MVQFDATLIVQIINFLILLAILNRIFYKPMLKVMNERQEALEGAEKSIQSKLGEIDNLQRTHKEKLDQARQNAHSLVSEQIQKAEQAREKLMSEIAQETADNLAQIKSNLMEESDKARQILDGQVEELAQLILTQLVEESDMKETAEVQ